MKNTKCGCLGGRFLLTVPRGERYDVSPSADRSAPSLFGGGGTLFGRAFSLGTRGATKFIRAAQNASGLLAKDTLELGLLFALRRILCSVGR